MNNHLIKATPTFAIDKNIEHLFDEAGPWF